MPPPRTSPSQRPTATTWTKVSPTRPDPFNALQSRNQSPEVEPPPPTVLYAPDGWPGFGQAQGFPIRDTAVCTVGPHRRSARLRRRKTKRPRLWHSHGKDCPHDGPGAPPDCSVPILGPDTGAGLKNGRPPERRALRRQTWADAKQARGALRLWPADQRGDANRHFRRGYSCLSRSYL